MINNKKIGIKIKNRRRELGLTQASVCDGFMTRNMLSLIESGSATPSLDTLVFLSEKLELPVAYLISEDDGLFGYEKQEKITYIKELYRRKNYEYCIKVISKLSDTDDELDYIYASCAFNLAKIKLTEGALLSAKKYIEEARRHADATVYDTREIDVTLPLYSAVASNIQSPLLELDTDAYELGRIDFCDYEFFKYVVMDTSYPFQNELYRRHLEAKSLLKKYAYLDALTILSELEEYKNTEYNAYVFLGIYSDMEIAYRQIGDFENAYRYSTKRLSLFNGFQT